MSPELKARLERDIEEGFGAPAAAPKTKWRLPSLRVLVPAMGTLAAALVALVIVTNQGPTELSSSGGDPVPNMSKAPAETSASSDSAGSADSPDATALAAPKVVEKARRSAGAGSAAAPLSADLTAPARERKVERRVSLVLETGEDKVESTADDVIRTVDRFRGIVASSSINADDAGSEATFDLRIPTSKLDAALAALSKLGHVGERRQDLQDITAAFTSTQERLTDARAERRGLLKALGNASTQAQIDSLRQRLAIVRGQIASAKAELSTLQRRASLSTVNVTVRGDGKPKSEGGWSLGDAGGDALRALEVIAGIALVAIAIALPLALLGAAILFGSHLARARRRENALDGAA